jgi:hypothetical protein
MPDPQLEPGDYVSGTGINGIPASGIVKWLSGDFVHIDGGTLLRRSTKLVGKQLCLPTNFLNQASAQGAKNNPVSEQLSAGVWIERKKVGGQTYFQYRWRDPATGKKRSRYIGKVGGQSPAAASSKAVNQS